MISLRDIVLKNKKLEHDLKDEFQLIFGKTLHDFMDPVTGFDLIAFDDYIKTPEGTSTHDWLAENNTRGFEIVKKLIGYGVKINE